MTGSTGNCFTLLRRQTPPCCRPGPFRTGAVILHPSVSRIKTNQNAYFKANCMERDPLALVILPKFELPSVVFGLPNCGVFQLLKASHRNSRRCCSRRRNTFESDVSHIL